MDNQHIEIEQFAKISGLSVSTIRRKIKSLSEMDKKTFIRHVPIIGSGGKKILIDKAWLGMMNKHEYASNKDMNSHDEPLAEKKENIQEQIKEPEQSNNDNLMIEILRGQIEYLQKQGEVKDSQISELLERLKESQYNLANTQKQITQPGPVEPHLKWWQFWK